MLRNMGSNVIDGSIKLGAKLIGIVQHICQIFQKKLELVQHLGTIQFHHLRLILK